MRQFQLSAKVNRLLGQVGGDSDQVRNLFRRLSSLFFQGTDRVGPAHRRMLHDILVDLLPKVDIRVRRELAGQLYSMEHPPRELVNLLIHDTIDVAGPLLEHAPLSDDDLIEVIENEGAAHHASIARRSHLSAAVKKALMRVGDTAPGQARLSEKCTKTDTETTSGQTTDFETNVAPFVPPSKNYRCETRPDEPDKSGTTAPEMADNQIKTDESMKRASGTGDISSDSPNIDIRHITRSRRRYEDITRASADWAWETGRAGQIIYLSDPAFQAFGRPAKTMTGFYLGDYCFPCDTGAPFQDFQEILDRRRPFRDLVILTRDTIGRDRHWWLSGVPCFDLASGRFTGFRGTALAVSTETHPKTDNDTEAPFQPLAEQPPVNVYPAQAGTNDTAGTVALDKETAPGISASAEKKAADMLQTLSHEFRTPLNAILGFSEMIEHETWGPVSEPYQLQTRKILKSARHLKNVVTDVLDAARVKAGKQTVSPRFFSLRQVVEASLQDAKQDIRELELNVSLADTEQDYTFLNDIEVFQKCLTKLLRAMFVRAEMNENCFISIKKSPENEVVVILPLMGPPVTTPDSATVDKAGRIDLESRIIREALGYPSIVATDLAKSIGCQVNAVWSDGRLVHIELRVNDFPADQTVPES